MKGKGIIIVIALTTGMFALGCGDAAVEHTANSETQQASASVAIAAPDMAAIEAFAKATASAGLMQVAMADIMTELSQNPAVEKLAYAIRGDHQHAGDKLRSIATAHGWRLPSAMTDADQRKVEKLRESPPELLDKEYLDIIVNTHQSQIDEIEKYLDKDLGVQLETWMETTLPMLRRHLETAKTLQDRTAMLWDVFTE